MTQAVFSGFSFSFGNYDFDYHAGTLTCLTIENKSVTRNSDAFKTYLVGFLSSYDAEKGYGEILPTKNSDAIQSERTKVSQLRRYFKDLTDDEAAVATALPTQNTGGPYRMYLDSVTCHKIPENKHWKPKEYDLQNKLLKIGELKIAYLMDLLVDIYPELDEYFFKTDRGVRLPFFEMNPKKFGVPNWPLPVSDKYLSAPSRGQASFTNQRWYEGAKLYNGNIYRLVSAKPGGWSLAKAKYFDVLDSCDILRARILADFGAVVDQDRESQKKALQKSPWVIEWLGNVRAILAGDFAGYAAGMATNMPIFYKEGNKLALILAEGSQKKAAGHGKFHVSPAGMIEFFKNTLSDSLFFENFRTILTKELYEEAFKHSAIIDPDVYDILEGSFLDDMNRSDEPPMACPGGRGNAFLEGIFQRVENSMIPSGDDFPPLVMSRKVRGLAVESTKTFQIVDAFRLRPEIIVPMKTSFMPELFLSWEYSPESPDQQLFPSLSALETYVQENMTRWAEPGLAAAYLGARAILKGQL